jgi:hypothetical protein
MVFFSNPALALLGQSLKKIPIRQKLNLANHAYFAIDFFEKWHNYWVNIQ